jgi:ribulose-5-phosphate 4-epimerase/fuculose-1-phosphate aldolase
MNSMRSNCSEAEWAARVDLDGTILVKPDFGTLDYGINKAGYVLHSAIHAARHEVACVIHAHTWARARRSSRAITAP